MTYTLFSIVLAAWLLASVGLALLAGAVIRARDTHRDFSGLSVRMDTPLQQPGEARDDTRGGRHGWHFARHAFH